MPAHTAEHEVGILVKSDGTALTAHDRRANAAADRFAKTAAEGRKFKRNLIDMLTREADEVTEMAIWLAKITLAANKFPLQDGTVIRDSQAEQPRPRRAKGRKRKSEPELSEVAQPAAAARPCKLPRLRMPNASSNREGRRPKTKAASAGPAWPPVSWDTGGGPRCGFRKRCRQQTRQGQAMSRFPAVMPSQFPPAQVALCSSGVTYSSAKTGADDSQRCKEEAAGPGEQATALGDQAREVAGCGSDCAAALEDLQELQRCGLKVVWPVAWPGAAARH
jgi:hypothetical protein